jgi:hypothetical protein
LKVIFVRAQAAGWIERRPEAAIDATGLEVRHASKYYVFRAGYRPFERCRFPKLTLVCHIRTHLFAAAVTSDGPSQDSPQFPQAMLQAAFCARWHRLLADAAYDGEHNHRLCREALGIRSTIIALNRRNTGRRWPKSPYRREMKSRSVKEMMGRRWHIESAISQHKRRLGSALRARTKPSQERECRLRVLTHNLMLLV